MERFSHFRTLHLTRLVMHCTYFKRISGCYVFLVYMCAMKGCKLIYIICKNFRRVSFSAGVKGIARSLELKDPAIVQEFSQLT
jgi:hypothetical protein